MRLQSCYHSDETVDIASKYLLCTLHNKLSSLKDEQGNSYFGLLIRVSVAIAVAVVKYM